jgi:squalene-hopene/tetraprenyl-beta-curcumene cyclase
MVKGTEAMERFAWVDEGGKWIQSYSSPVWDTLFMIRAISEAGLEGGFHPNDERIVKSVKWCMERQTKNESVGDWKVYKPNLKAGGFAFEMYNTWYPDVDDTAVAIIAFLEQNPASVESDCIVAAANWIFVMQSSDGGWASFDVDNDKLWLNKIPFSDIDALCDPSTADVTGRILEALGLMMQCAKEQCIDLSELSNRMDIASHRAIAFIAKEQEKDGSWYRQWSVNYIYGTSNVLCGLQYFKQDSILVHEMMSAGAEWLKKMQNSDGGWGEGVVTYEDPSKRGAGTSTASQSAWALMGLLTMCEPYDESVMNGVAYLVET